MNILETIVKAKFLADEKQVESLAGIVGEGINASGTYLSVLVAHTQEGLHHKRKPGVDAQLSIVDAVHERFYPCVLRGLGPQDMADEERNRRGIFARSAASDLRYFIRKGGDVRAIDPATISKAKLRAEGKEVPTGTRTERSIVKASDAWERAIRRLAKRNLDEARAQIIEQQAKLETLLAEIGRPAPVKARKVAKKAAHRGRHVARGEAARAPAH